jgi:hypothetical protein
MILENGCKLGALDGQVVEFPILEVAAASKQTAIA